MKARIKKVFFSLLGLFLILFLFRLAYGYTTYPNSNQSNTLTNVVNSFASRDGFYRNIASSKYEYQKGSTADGQIISVDQKYEKTANISCKSEKFEEDEKAIRQTIKNNNAIIQFQQKSGNRGNRQLHLQIGVQPDIFDEFVEQIRQQQRVIGFDMTKKDKTNEYRELNSKISTLQATRASLVELKSKGGKIEEYIDLENRILEIDEKLQTLGVQMGQFDSENEFCTVNISLQEGQPTKISFMQRIKVALEWTIEFYLMLTFGLMFAAVIALVLVIIVDKLKILTKLQ